MRDNRADTPNAPLARATFIVSGDTVLPDVWTCYFGMLPDRGLINAPDRIRAMIEAMGGAIGIDGR